MKYALGNMLNGAGGLNPDGLSLDLQFAADKTLTARKGPTPVFTRASSGRFVGSDGLIQSAGNNIARFDHDPVTLACKGLLIEESRTNLLQRSEEFNNAYWVKFQMQLFGSGSIANTTETFAPDGSNNADKLVENTVTDRHQIGDVGPATTVGTYTYSIFVKKPAGSAVSHIMVVFGGVAAAGVAATSLNLTTLGIGDTLGGSNLNSSAIQYPNGWINLRCTVTTTVAGALNPNILFSRNGLFVNRSYTGDGTSGVYLWGAQLEAGSFPTSYIPTTTAPLARSADVCDVIGADIHPSVGTLVVEFDRRSLNSSIFRSPGRVSASASATGADYVGIDHNDTQIRTPIRAANATVSALAFNSTSIGTTKTAVAWSSGDSSHVSGGVVRISTSAAIAFANPLDTISFCGIPPSAICTTISRIRYFKKRLSNAKLQALTV